MVRRIENNKNIIQNIEEDDLEDHIDLGCEHDELDTYVGFVEEEDGMSGINGIKKKKMLSEEEEPIEDPDGGDEDPDGGDPDDPEDEDPDDPEDEDPDDPDNENDDLGELEDPEDVPIEDDDLGLIPESEDLFI